MSERNAIAMQRAGCMVQGGSSTGARAHDMCRAPPAAAVLPNAQLSNNRVLAMQWAGNDSRHKVKWAGSGDATGFVVNSARARDY